MCVRAHNGHLRDYTLVGWYIIEVLCIMAVSNFDFITDIPQALHQHIYNPLHII